MQYYKICSKDFLYEIYFENWHGHKSVRFLQVFTGPNGENFNSAKIIKCEELEDIKNRTWIPEDVFIYAQRMYNLLVFN